PDRLADGRERRGDRGLVGADVDLLPAFGVQGPSVEPRDGTPGSAGAEEGENAEEEGENAEEQAETAPADRRAPARRDGFHARPSLHGPPFIGASARARYPPRLRSRRGTPWPASVSSSTLPTTSSSSW